MQKLFLACVWVGMLPAAPLPAQTGPLDTNASPAPSSIPFVPTRHDAVKDLLWLANVTNNDVVYDLGSGDGRVVIAAVRDFGARRAVGIEINPELIAESRANAAKAGVAGRVEFIQGDLFTNDFSPASVVVLYLGHGANLDLRARLVRTLKPGSRIVAHQFGMGEWTPDKELDVRTQFLGMYGEASNPFSSNPEVPEFKSNGRTYGHDYLSVWVVPAPVAGIWRGKVKLDGKEQEVRLTLHQRLSRVTGSFEFQGTTNFDGNVQADLWGDHLRFNLAASGVRYGEFLALFDGHVKGETMTGTLAVTRSNQIHEIQWEGRRDKADFTGTWEWAGPKGTPIRLNLERHNGQIAASYLDTNRDLPPYLHENGPLPVADIYDFGGGFYFTLLLGNSPTYGRMAGPDCGWVIGEAVVTNNAFNGTIAFYPYPELGSRGVWPTGTQPPTAGNPRTAQAGPREWRSKRIAP